VHRDVAASGIAVLAAVEQPQVRLLRIIADRGEVLQRVVDWQEHRRAPIQRGDGQRGLEQPSDVGVGHRLQLIVDQRQLDDATAVAGPDGDGEQYTRGVLLGAGQRDSIRLLTAEVDLSLVRHRLPGPGAALLSVLLGELLFGVLAPRGGHGQDVDATGHGEGQAHRRRPDPAQGLRGEHIGELGLAITADTVLGVGHLIGLRNRGRRVVLRAQHAYQVPLSGTARVRRELLALAVPRAEQVALDQLTQLVTDLVRARAAESLRGVQRRSESGRSSRAACSPLGLGNSPGVRSAISATSPGRRPPSAPVPCRASCPCRAARRRPHRRTAGG